MWTPRTSSGAEFVDAALDRGVHRILFGRGLLGSVLRTILQSIGALLIALGRALFRHSVRGSGGAVTVSGCEAGRGRSPASARSGSRELRSSSRWQMRRT